MTEPICEYSALTAVEGEAIAKRLGSRNPVVRHKAEQEILGMGTSGHDLLLSIVHHGEFERLSSGGLYYWLRAGILLGLTVIAINSHRVIPFIGMFMALLPIMCLKGFVMAQADVRSYATACLMLAKHFEQISIVGPMAGALGFSGAPIREVAATALTRLLPLLREEHVDLFTPRQRNNLHRAILSNNPELVLASLGALSKMGDSRTLPNVQKLASGLGLAAKDSSIREAADRTLLILRKCIRFRLF